MSYNKDHIVHLAQLKNLLENNVKILTSGVLLSAILAYIEWPLLGQTLTLQLFFAMLIVNLLRGIVSHYHLKHHSDEHNIIKKRINIFRAGLLITSLIWGINGYIVFKTQSSEHQLFMVYILTGISTGAVVAYSIERVSALIYLYFSLAPMLLMLFNSPNQIYIAMGVSGFLYTLFATINVYSFNKKLLEGVLLKYEADKRENEIKQIAFYDVLTGLPNRRLLQDRLQHALVVSQRYGKAGSLLFIDLDKFKLLNDTYGHEKGDLLLKKVADRLKSSVRKSDTVCRYGGDEFVVMLENLSEDIKIAKEQTLNIANNLLNHLKQPYQLDEIDYTCTPSIGIAMFGEHGHTDDALLRNADTAMYQAKKSGGNVLKMYEESTANTRKK